MERRLFVFGEEVIRIAVKHHFPDPLYRNQRLGDQLGGIQQIEVKRLFILFRDQLQTQLILRIIAGFYRFPQIAAMEIRSRPVSFCDSSQSKEALPASGFQ